MAKPWERYQQETTVPEMAGPWLRYAVPQDVPATSGPGWGDALGQFMSGTNEGLANILGFPVDMLNAGVGLGMSGINAIAGTDFQPSPQPFGGSESLRGLMAPAIMPESDDTSLQFTRRVGQEIGASLPVGLGTMGLAARPAQMLATEMGLAGAAGVGAGLANQVFPDNDMADMVGSLVGLGAGAVGPNALRRLATPNPSNPVQEALAQQLIDEGVPLTAGQRTGNVPLRYMESELGQGTATKLMEDQAEAFTQAALQRAGISASRATPEVMRQSYAELGQRFDDMAMRTTVDVDQQFAEDIIGSVQNYMDLVPPSAQAPIVSKTIDDLSEIIDRAAPIPGETYQAFRSRIGRAASGTSDPELKSALFDIQAALDDAAERTLSRTNPGALDDWRQLRSDYRNFLILDRAAGAAGEGAAQGIITPAQLAGAVRGVAGRRAYSQGTNELGELARAGVGVMSSLPNSGTASRLAARGLPTAMGAVMGGMTGDALATMGGALAGQAVPSVAGRGILSGPGRSYLGNQRFLPETLPAGAGTSAGSAILANEEISPTREKIIRLLIESGALQ